MKKVFKISDFELTSFKGVAAKESPEGEILLIPSGAVFPQRLKSEKFKKIKLENVSKNLQNGDILFNTGGVGTLGRCGYFAETTGVHVPDSFVLVLRFLEPKIFSKYVFYFLQTSQVKASIIQKTSGTTGITSIKPKDVLSLEIPIPVDKNGNPDLAEQKRIVAILEEAETLKKKYVEAEQKMGTVVPALFSKMFGNKESWNASFEMESLSDLVEVTSGGTPSTKEDRFWGGNIPWVSAKDMKTDLISDSIDHITEEALSETTLKYIERNSVLIVVRGMILARYIPISLAANRLTINQDLKALVPKPGKVSGVFLWAMLRAIEWQLKFAIKTAAHGTKKLDTSDLIEIKIPVPSIELQNQFSELVKEIEIQKEKQKQSAGKLDKIFQSLLRQIF